MPPTHRLWEVDSARGIAILMMVVSNLLLDLYLFAGLLFPQEGFWLYFARATAGLFILVAGVSLTLSFSRAGPGFSKYLKRGARIFSWGLAITAVSWLFLPGEFVVFGVLHLIGIGIILAYPLLRYRLLNLVLGSGLIAGGVMLRGIYVEFPWLVWLGLKYRGFYSVDYVPLMPWLGVMLLGIFAGNLLFPGGRKIIKTPDLSGILPVKLLTVLGRNSLLIYLVHQPVFVGIIFLLFRAPL